MKRMAARIVPVLLAAGLVLCAPAAFAQDQSGQKEEKVTKPAKKTQGDRLVDLARKTRQEREGQKTEKVYTNTDLKTARGNVSSSSLPAAKEPAKATGETGQSKQDDINNEYYQKVVAQYRQIADLERQRDVKLLEYQRLRTSYANSPSGVYQNQVLKPEMDQAYQAHLNFKSEAEAARKKLDDLKNEARKKGVPAGVIRKAEEEGQKYQVPGLNQSQGG